tara:strand:- start:156 stop:293 length:138 start_codon:yes stop_codon:yes gene_type:complete
MGCQYNELLDAIEAEDLEGDREGIKAGVDLDQLNPPWQVSAQVGD